MEWAHRLMSAPGSRSSLERLFERGFVSRNVTTVTIRLALSATAITEERRRPAKDIDGNRQSDS